MNIARQIGVGLGLRWTDPLTVNMMCAHRNAGRDPGTGHPGREAKILCGSTESMSNAYRWIGQGRGISWAMRFC